jgi:hypothetical protein
VTTFFLLQLDPSCFCTSFLISRQGETENQVLAFADEHKELVEACVAKPGLMPKPGNPIQGAFATIMGWAGVVPLINVSEVAAAMLDQVDNGFEKEPLENDDLIRIGKKALEASIS